MQLKQFALCQCETGASLIELMIGLALGLMITASALAMLASTTSGAASAIGSAKLNMELRGSMDVMVEDIRRAGFGLDVCNPTLTTKLSAHDSDNDGISDCIVYAYNDSGKCKFYGFRVQSGAIWSRDNEDIGDTSDCVNGSWQRFTDPDTVTVDDPDSNQPYFDISYRCVRANDISGATTLSPAPEPCIPGQNLYNDALAAAQAADTRVGLVEVREVTIRIPGHLSNDSDMKMTLSQSVTVRNHRAVIVPSP